MKAITGIWTNPHSGHVEGRLGLRLLAPSVLALLVALILAGPAPAAPGDLDPSFDADGMVTTDSNRAEPLGRVPVAAGLRLVCMGERRRNDDYVTFVG